MKQNVSNPTFCMAAGVSFSASVDECMVIVDVLSDEALEIVR